MQISLGLSLHYIKEKCRVGSFNYNPGATLISVPHPPPTPHPLSSYNIIILRGRVCNVDGPQVACLTVQIYSFFFHYTQVWSIYSGLFKLFVVRKYKKRITETWTVQKLSAHRYHIYGRLVFLRAHERKKSSIRLQINNILYKWMTYKHWTCL